MNTPHVEPPEDDGWQCTTWMRGNVGHGIHVNLMTGHNLRTEHVDPPALLIDGPDGSVELQSRAQLDALLAALGDAARLWDALTAPPA